LTVKPVRRRTAVIAAVVVVAVAAPGAVVAGKVAGLRRLGTPVTVQTTPAPAPGPLAGDRAGWTAKADGRITDLAVLPGRGEVVYVEALAQRSWRATAVDAHTGAVRWRNARGNTGHIEAWAVTDAAVVLAYHHSASRLAWRTLHAASFEGVDPVSGKVLWTRHVYNLLGDGPGDYAPLLASPADDVVFARTEFGIPTAVDTRTGQTLWEYPGLDGCRADEVAAGPAGVAMTQRCPDGKERIELLNARTGKPVWKTEISTPALRLLAVGSNSVAVYQGGSVNQLIVLGPGGTYVSTTPCDCGDGQALTAGVTGGTAFNGGPLQLIGVGGTVLVGGPFGLLAADGGTGQVLWQRAVPGGPVHRVLAQDGDAYVIGGDGALLHLDPADGATQVVVPGAAGKPLDPGALVAAVNGYIAAGTGGGFAFFGPTPPAGTGTGARTGAPIPSP
jgi:outer membrane protein assembly factor BamB